MEEIETTGVESEDRVDVLERHRVESVSAIMAFLNEASKKGVQLTMFFGGESFILTSVVEVDKPRRLVAFESGRDPSANRKLLERRESTCVGFLDKVKIQFRLEDVREGKDDAGNRVFIASVPKFFYHFQRRDSFRVRVPMKFNSVLSFNHPETKNKVEVSLFDISIGGLSVMLHSESDEMEAGTVLKGVKISISGLGEGDLHAQADMEVRNLVKMDRAGKYLSRMGMAFVLGRDASLERKLSKTVSHLDRAAREI